MRRTDFLSGVTAVGAAVPLLGLAPLPKSVAGVSIPDSALAKEATAMAMSSEPSPIFNHSLRTFLFAELVARADSIDHDVERVYVASLLHDLGLVDAYSSEKDRFEVDGANAARDLLRKHGVEATRVDTVWDAITLHDCGGIARWKQPVVRLVNAGVAVDFGGYLDTLQRQDVVAVLQAAPRTDFIPVFLAAVAGVAKKKPGAASDFVIDVGNRMVPGFKRTNFCDAVKTDPFAGFTPAAAP